MSLMDCRLEVMDRLAVAYNDHDVKGVVGCMTNDCVFYAAQGPDPAGTAVQGTDAIARRTKDWFEDFPDSQWLGAQHSVALDGRGITTWTLVLTDRGGHKVKKNGCDVFEFRDEKIARKDTYTKMSTMQNQPQ